MEALDIGAGGRHHHGAQRRLAIALYHHGQQGVAALEGDFHPFRINIAAIGGDQQVLAPAVHVQVAVLVQPAQVAGGPFGAGVLADVASHHRAADPDFAVRVDAYPGMGQHPADAAGTVGAGHIQGHHRAALGQAIAFVYRQAQVPCPDQQPGIHLAAAHGDETQ